MRSPEVGVCSWSLQATSIPELTRLMNEVGAGVVQVGLGDPTHGSWEEGPGFVSELKASGLKLTGTMIGFPGEDYTSPATIRATGGFGNLQTRRHCVDIFKQAVEQTVELGVNILLSHAGFIPEPESSDRGGFLDTLAEVGDFAASKGVTFAMETGQETAELLRRTLDELSLDSLKVNFDPANMILYGMGDPIRAVHVLGPDIVHVHVKDARPPKKPGEWGEEVPLGEGDVGMAKFLDALSEIGYSGPFVVEREVGDQSQRVEEIRNGIQLLRRLITEGA